MLVARDSDHVVAASTQRTWQHCKQLRACYLPDIHRPHIRLRAGAVADNPPIDNFRHQRLHFGMVDAQHREIRPAAGMAPGRLAQGLGEAGAVEQARQRVVLGQVAHALVGLAVVPALAPDHPADGQASQGQQAAEGVAREVQRPLGLAPGDEGPVVRRHVLDDGRADVVGAARLPQCLAAEFEKNTTEFARSGIGHGEERS